MQKVRFYYKKNNSFCLKLNVTERPSHRTFINNLNIKITMFPTNTVKVHELRNLQKIIYSDITVKTHLFFYHLLFIVPVALSPLEIVEDVLRVSTTST